MFSNGMKNFELRLGKLGLIIFVLGISVLVFLSFQFGVIVGKNIDSYPDKVAWGLPAFIKQKIVRKTDTESAKKEITPEAVGSAPADVNLTFYDTLAGKKQKVDLSQTRQPDDKGGKAPVQEPAAPEKTTLKSAHFVQVVSLKDEKKADALRKRLGEMGYQCEVDITETTSGKFYRVKLTGFESRDEAVKAANAVEKKTSLKCIVLGSK